MQDFRIFKSTGAVPKWSKPTRKNDFWLQMRLLATCFFEGLELNRMHTESIERWMHDHTFGQDARKPGERRTLVVIFITLITMTVEITAGIMFGSMALTADGLHMGSHASALLISAFAYYYTRRHAKDMRFNFGTGKVNSLAAFASAVMLVLFALVMAGESVHRILFPVSIGFNQAIFVAVIGLAVNGICLVILGGHGHSDDEYDKDYWHEHEHENGHEPRHDESYEVHSHQHHYSRHRDHNLWSAYLHVLADALTSVLAIFALLGGKYLGQSWLDPFMGIVGAVLVTRWSWGLLRSSAHVLLDMQAPETLRGEVRKVLESVGDNRVSDLHLWAVGPEIYAAEITLVSSNPLDVEDYYNLLPRKLGVVHITVESRQCPSNGCKP
jgi:cation diffusion facilitator family transporter